MAKLTQIFHESGGLLSNFACDWSEDNKVAVATQDAVCIYEVKCKPREREPTAAGVYAEIRPDPEQNLCFNKDLPLASMSKEADGRATDIFMDTVMMSVTTENEVFKGFRRAIWSPPGMAAADGCLLATLSWDRRARIYDVSTPKPRLVHTINDQWQEVAGRFTEKVKNSKDVRNHAYCLSIIDMVWTGLAGPSQCHLITVSRSGHLAAWSVRNAEMKLVRYWQLASGDDRVSCLAWHQGGYLLVGRHSGRLQGIRVKLKKEFSISEQWDILEDDDLLPVSAVVHGGPEKNCLFVAKGFVVMVLLYVEEAGKLKVIKSDFTRLEGGEVTGLSILGPGRALVSTLFNQFWLLELKGDEPTSTTLETSPITIIIDTQHYSCHALALSPHRVIACTVERVFDYYDHLILREPLRISFTLLDNPLDQLYNSVLQSPRELHWLTDLLEAARLTMSVDKAPLALQSDDAILRVASRRQLQCSLFTAVSSPVNADAASAAPGPNGCAERIRIWLLRDQLKTLLVDVQRCGKPSGDSWSRFLRRTETLLAMTKASLDTIVTAMPPCGVCGQTVEQMNSLQAVCAAGHRLPVCCQTTSLCELTPYRRCHQCGAFAVCSAQRFFGVELGGRCTFCDGRLCDVV